MDPRMDNEDIVLDSIVRDTTQIMFNDATAIDRLWLEGREPAEVDQAVLTIIEEVRWLSCTPIQISEDLVFFQSLIREDYDELVDSVMESCSQRTTRHIKHDGSGKKRSTPRNLIFCNRHAARLSKFCGNVTSSEKILLTFSYIKTCLVVAPIAGNKAIFDVVVFASMQKPDSLLCHLINMRGGCTYTLQHGLYLEYQDLKTVNVVNYLVQPAKYFLAWGEHTKDLIEKFHPGVKVKICGKPVLSC